MIRKNFKLIDGVMTPSFSVSGKRHSASRHARFVGGSGGTGADDEEAKKALLLEVRAAAKEEMKSDKTYKEFETVTEQWKTMPLEAVRALCDEKTGVLARFAKLDSQMLEFEQRASAAGQKELTIRGQIEAWAEKNKTSIDAIRNKKMVAPDALELNMRVAASPMTPANTYVAGSVLPPQFYEAGVNDPVRPQPTFWDYLTKGSTSFPAYGWVNKVNIQGAAGFIGPGVLKPQLSFQLKTEISNYKKIAVTDKVTVELLWDIPGFETMVKDELRYAILHKLNTALMNNIGTATEPTGIQQLSVAFTTSGLDTTNPSYFDALRAVVAQMRAGNITGAITIFINPIDSANMDMSKATTSGVYLLPSFVTPNGKNVAGATIVEDNNITIGEFQAAFLQYYRVLIYKNLTLTFGWENDDFTKNLITYLAEMAIHQFFNTQYTGAFVHDSFANVIAAITAPVIP